MKNKIIITFFIILSIIASSLTRNIQPVENKMIPNAVGYDKQLGTNEYIIRIMAQNPEMKGKDILYTGTAMTPGGTRQNRQLSSNKEMSFGFEKVNIFSDYTARSGINAITDILFENAQLNDKSLVAVCDGSTEGYLNYKRPGIVNIGDYLEGMIKNSINFNFFSKNYRVMDIYVRLDVEGRNFIAPYIVRDETGIYIDGLAIFKKDKMVYRTNIEEAKIINILRENNVKGIISIRESEKKYSDVSATIKRKVYCTKINNKYNFNINLNVKAEIVSNSLYKDINNSVGEQKDLEKRIKEKIEMDSNEFINKMKYEYKMDLLELGRSACAKYGRDTGTDWDKKICDSNIKVTTKVSLVRLGRGEY